MQDSRIVLDQLGRQKAAVVAHLFPEKPSRQPSRVKGGIRGARSTQASPISNSALGNSQWFPPVGNPIRRAPTLWPAMGPLEGFWHNMEIWKCSARENSGNSIHEKVLPQ
jgi:hypothetical protein